MEFLAKVAPAVSETWSPVSEKQHVVSSTPVENEATDSVPTKDTAEDPQSFDCIQCDRSFKKKNALAVHVGKEHKTIEQLDGAYTSINEEMSFDHDKEEEEDEDESWKVVRTRRKSREEFKTWCQERKVIDQIEDGEEYLQKMWELRNNVRQMDSYKTTRELVDEWRNWELRQRNRHRDFGHDFNYLNYYGDRIFEPYYDDFFGNIYSKYSKKRGDN